MTFPRGPRGVQLTKLVLDIDVGRVTRRAAACIAALVLAAATAGCEPRGAALSLPAGWRIERNELVWTSAAPLRMGGARYEFRSRDQLLGYPATRGNALRLPLRSFGSLAELSVWAGGRRIDAGAQQLRVHAETPIAEPEIAQAPTDPAAPGPYRAQRLRYTLPGLALEGYAVPVEVVAEVSGTSAWCTRPGAGIDVTARSLGALGRPAGGPDRAAIIQRAEPAREGGSEAAARLVGGGRG
jgi:hypothetical protein